MRLVQHAAQRPHRCAVIPYLSNHNSRGFFDTGVDLPGWDPHVYVSVEAAEAMATELGWIHKSAVAGAMRQVEERSAIIAELEQRVAELEAQLEAVDTLRNAGFKTKERKVAA